MILADLIKDLKAYLVTGLEALRLHHQTDTPPLLGSVSVFIGSPPPPTPPDPELTVPYVLIKPEKGEDSPREIDKGRSLAALGLYLRVHQPDRELVTGVLQAEEEALAATQLLDRITELLHSLPYRRLGWAELDSTAWTFDQTETAGLGSAKITTNWTGPGYTIAVSVEDAEEVYGA